MARIAGVDLPRNKRMEIALTYIYGIGKVLSVEILNRAGVALDKRSDDLEESEIRKIRDVIETCIFGRRHSIRRQDAAAKQWMLRKPQPKDALFGNRRFTFLRHILTQRSQDPTGITQTQHPAPRNDVVRARCFDGRNHRLHDRYRNLIVVVLRAATQNTQFGPPFKPCHLREDGDPMNRNWTDKFCFHRIPFTKRRTICSPISWVRVASS